MKLCDYGCGQEAKYQFGNGKWCCSKNHKSCPSLRNRGIPDPKTNIANLKIPCPYCSNPVQYANLERHKESCYSNPENIKFCKQCGKMLQGGEQKVFCSTSCAASYNNKRRKHSLETKRKISRGVGGEGIAREEKTCSMCGKKGIVGKKYCKDCYAKISITPEIINSSRLAWQRYEKELLPRLESLYGSLTKEIINNIAFDYCNSSYVIEFTFDYGSGTSTIIKRFEQIPNDKRKRVAFIPDKWVGVKRRAILNKLKVQLESAEPFRKFL